MVFLHIRNSPWFVRTLFCVDPHYSSRWRESRLPGDAPVSSSSLLSFLSASVRASAIKAACSGYCAIYLAKIFSCSLMGWGDGNCSSLGPAATVGCRRRARFVWFRRAEAIKGGEFRTFPVKRGPSCPPLCTRVGRRSTETTGDVFADLHVSDTPTAIVTAAARATVTGQRHQVRDAIFSRPASKLVRTRRTSLALGSAAPYRASAASSSRSRAS